MKPSKIATPIAAVCLFCLTLFLPSPALADAAESSIAACLKVWAEHPFGQRPQFKTLDTSVTLFGIGSAARDTQPRPSPALVLVKPIFNVAGSATVELSDPNGWYCMQTTLSVVGRVHIRAHCKAHLAMTSDGKTVRGDNAENRSIRDVVVTVMGSVPVERPCD